MPNLSGMTSASPGYRLHTSHKARFHSRRHRSASLPVETSRRLFFVTLAILVLHDRERCVRPSTTPVPTDEMRVPALFEAWLRAATSGLWLLVLPYRRVEPQAYRRLGREWRTRWW